MNPDKRIVIPRPILPSPSSPRTPTQNRFAPLIPTYSSVTRPRNRPPYSPLAHLQGIPPTINPYNRSPTSVSSPSRPKSPSINTEVQFHTNHHKQTIKILEPFEEQKLNQGFPVLLEYLWPKNTNFYTNDFQTREYYEMILIDTGSIQVKHNFDPNDSKVIKFSKVKINKILSPEDWGNRAFTIKVLSKFPEWPGYTYHDYIEAWNKAFLLRAFSHTWFFHFSEDFSLEYPRWFIQWFQYFGIIPESFPPKILAGYEHFKELFKQEEAPMFEYTLQFAAVFKLPWIMSFNHKKQERQGTGPPLLIRQFSVKWWKQIEDKQASKEAVIRYYNDITTGSSNPSPSCSTRPMIKDDSDDIPRRIRDCKEEDLARIISEIRSSPSTSEDLFQDSQDPYDM
ncbi:hypothetical protein Tco_1008483 [Tanacetum coccineum]